MTPANCLQDAIDTAVHTFGEREARYGSSSAQLRDWVQAQDAVFANCEEYPLSLPAAATTNADALTKADRAYQTAAAYFYAMQYEEAARRFRAIGDDPTSPWRPYGRYLSARAHIRIHTMSGFVDNAPSTALVEAEKELLAVIEDPIATTVRESARDLLTFVRLRLRPRDELRAVSTRITSDASAGCCAFDDLTYLLDQQVGVENIEYGYERVKPEAIRDAHDLVDWILAFQGVGDAARDRAISRWQTTKSLPWLVAAISQINGQHPVADALLDAAAQVPESSAAYASASFYRIRLLIDLGRVDAARAALSTLPDAVGPGATAETINLYRAERLRVARTLDELLHAVVRSTVRPVGQDREPLPIFDEDAGTILDERLPLDRLVAAAQSTVLPDRLRARVATAAFTRAVLLNRQDAAGALVPLLRSLAPQMSADLDRYTSETTDVGRRRAFTWLLLHTPGLSMDVQGLDDSSTIEYVEPRRTFGNFVPVWWCAPGQLLSARERAQRSEMIRLLYQSSEITTPSFIGAEERAAATRERDALDRVGAGPRYLAIEALNWAKSRPTDPEVAEVLSRLVNNWRRACREDRDADLARQAFQTLHRQFPNSEWAKRTKYWYR